MILAPREGLIAARNIRLGEYAGVGTRLMAVAPTRALWIEANLRETRLSRIRAGDRVQIRVDAADDQVFCGTVESLSAASGSEFAVIPPDNATGNFTKIVRRFPSADPVRHASAGSGAPRLGHVGRTPHRRWLTCVGQGGRPVGPVRWLSLRDGRGGHA
ncbi:HlyD family secretion protein [Caulobacter segnis]